MPKIIDSWKTKAKLLKVEVYALYLAYQDPRTPWYAKVTAAIVAGYAFSPIDLIPDPIPILGYLDDLVLLPLGVLLAVKLIPPQVLQDCRAQAQVLMAAGKPINKVAAMVIVLIWLAAAVITFLWIRSLRFT